MEAVLAEHFTHEAPSILVADEFHMLSEEHKRELFAWFSTRLSWLKVFIIVNRSNGKLLVFLYAHFFLYSFG